MTVQRGIPLWVLLLGAVVPLHAQFTTYGCPAAPTQILNGFTAGTTAPSQICLNGTFQTSLVYDVTLTRTDNNQQALVTAAAGGNLLTVTVPASFYATDPSNAVIPVTISIFAPQLSGTAQTGSFQINPPLAQGGPIFIATVNTAATFTLFTGGTQPYQDEYNSGSFPTGMNNLDPASNTLSGTPSQTGVFQFSVVGTDSWGDEFFTAQAAYIVPVPQITGTNPTSAVVGAAGFPLTINGNGFVSPINIGSSPQPGSMVQITPIAGAPITLTPTNYSANQLTVNLPANLFTSEGVIGIAVTNSSVTAPSNQFLFPVNPVITGLNPSIRTVGTPAFTMVVTGAGFANGAAVLMNGTLLPTTFVNSTTLTATVPTVNAPAQVLIEVVNSDETASNAQPLTFVAAPTLISLKPGSVNAGGPAFGLLLTGTGFRQGMVVYFNAAPLTPFLVQNQQNNQFTVSVPAQAIAQAGIVPVWVATVDGYSTPSLPFTIVSTGPPPLQLQTFSPLPPGVVNTRYSTTFVASQGAGGYEFSVTGGAVPAGLTLSPAGVLSGTPTAYGPSQFTVQVADSAGSTVSRSFTLYIAPAPLTLTTGPLANTQINTPISIQFAGSGGIPPYTFVEFGTLPPGTSINSAG